MEVSTGNLVIPYTINAVDWVQDYIPKLGLTLGNRIIVEIPSDGKIFQEAMTHLSKAENAYRNWDPKGVFSNCREIGKLLDAQVRQKLGKDNVSYKEIWGRAFGLFEHWASLDLHNEEIKQKYGDVEVNAGKSDAEYLLLNTKILIKYVQELLTN